MVNNYVHLKQENPYLCIRVLHIVSITPRNLKPNHSSPEKSSSEVVWLERKMKTKLEGKAEQGLCIFLSTGITSVVFFSKDYTKRYI